MQDVLKKIKQAYRGTQAETIKLFELATNGLIRPSHFFALSVVGFAVVIAAAALGMWVQAVISLIFSIWFGSLYNTTQEK